MKHATTPRFWQCYNRLPKEIAELADKNFELLKGDPSHPSLHFKRIDKLWSARVGLHYRVLGADDGDRVIWFWIGTHADYDKLIK